MRRSSVKPALLHLFAIVLMIMGTVPSHAQYYINIRQTDGTRLRYAVSAVDSLWFDKDEQQEPEYVDLGLSVLWATFNVGASKPEEYGDYFAWGETEPYYEAGYAQEDPQSHWMDGKTAGYDYGYSTYKHCNGSNNTLTKYCNKNYYGYKSFTDTRTTLDPDDDVAHVKWGGNWRMPTQTEFAELRNSDNCTCTWTTKNGVNGYLITSKKSGHEGASIFLPAAGYRVSTDLYRVGFGGSYWSSSLNTDDPRNAHEFIYDSDHTSMGSTGRLLGLPVRPVCPSSTYTPPVDDVVESIELNPSQVSMTVGDEPIQITATPRNNNGNAVDAKVVWSTSEATVALVADDGTVYPVGVGNCTITVSVGDVKSTCAITVTAHSPAVGYENGYEYVDLGLRVKWATCNVGAERPEDYGDYFAWGETEPYYEAGYAQEDPQAHWKEGCAIGYLWCTYKYSGSSYNLTNLTKYNKNGEYGMVDDKTVLDESDDAAHMKWGGNWRMPTSAEFAELCDTTNCTWTWITRNSVNGVNGCLITSKKKGYEGASIFLPAAGSRDGTSLRYVDSYGYYWSSSLTLYSRSSYRLSFNPVEVDRWAGALRCGGLSVRPVCP